MPQRMILRADNPRPAHPRQNPDSAAAPENRSLPFRAVRTMKTPKKPSRHLFLVAALAAACCAARAQPVSLGSLLLSEAALDQATARGEVTGRSGPPPARDDADAEAGGRYRGYLPAALEILGFQALLNRVDYAFIGPKSDYDVSLHTIRDHLHSSWVVDRDPFEVNQLGHPYQGSMYFGFARSNGFGFWSSFGYAFAGSAVWEIAGETTTPSRNDQITTSIGGSFLGESLYRMSNLVLEHGYGLSPGWREVATAALSPPVAFNRYFRPGKGSGIFDSHDPALFARLQLGGSAMLNNNAGSSLAQKRNEYAADFALDYGMPGKPGYQYRRPFDYFSFGLRLTNVRGIESLNTRGLLIGTDYAAGRSLRGIWGLYGSYDYLAPELFRVASTGLSLGTTAQWWLGESVALQGHASAGMGYTSIGTVSGNSDRQYNYGFAPLAAASLRLIFGNALSLDLNAREYFDGKLTSPDSGGTDRVFRGDAALTWRVHRNHAIALKYITSRRNYAFPNVTEQKQRQDSIGLYYTYQPADGFGAVRW
jgi:hypothetical protein